MKENYSYRQEFRERLSELRIQHDISARDMSLSLGLSESYINKTENGRILPTMETFFEICNFLEVTPYEFWNTEVALPTDINIAVEELNKLSLEQLSRMICFMKDINGTKK